MVKAIRELLFYRAWASRLLNHWSSSFSYVVLTFGLQRAKTPVIKRTLNPKYVAKDATFELPIYASEVERYGAFLDFVVWDKEIIGKGTVACSRISL